MARPAAQAYTHYQRALALWPKDNLRPTCQLQDVVRESIGNRFKAESPSVNERKELAQVNALYSLVGDRYVKKYPLNGDILNPKSQPTYFQDLIRELEEAPNKSWFSRVSDRISGLIRLQ